LITLSLVGSAIHEVLAQHKMRLEGNTNGVVDCWRGKSVIVGSSGVLGNSFTDRGATPLQTDTLLVSQHLNVANTLITSRFNRRSPLWLELTLIVLFGTVTAALTYRMRVVMALPLEEGLNTIENNKASSRLAFMAAALPLFPSLRPLQFAPSTERARGGGHLANLQNRGCCRLVRKLFARIMIPYLRA
jgi:CHASE2 domain-containing sensor protein